ncbi:MAG TPA: ATP-binding protein [Ktedonobacteraceae bacterium]|nr:ATP-binding protein [Ktedonobacteraceae bacterium]
MDQVEYLPPLHVGDRTRWKHYSSDGILAIVSALLITGIIFVFKLYPRIPNISVAYLLIVLALASTRGMLAAVIASVVAFLSFDFFLVPPLYTFTIGKVDEWLALFIFLATAITTGQLASALRQRAEQARRREREARILYELLRDTNREEDLERQLRIIARAVVDVFSPWGVRDCAILLPDAQGKLIMQASTRETDESQALLPDEVATAAWVMAQAQTAELHDVLLAPQSSDSYAQRVVLRSTKIEHPVRRIARMVPLKLGQRVVGVLRLSMEDDPRLFDIERSLGVEREHIHPDSAFFWTFVDQAASVIERERLRRESLQVEVLQRTDALRAALLSSVSHDLRTPLSSIKAAASSLLQEDVQWDDEARRSFAQAIVRESDRLNRLVANLLDMSRIEAGVLKPEKEWYPLDELIHDVLGRMQPLFQGRQVHTDIPDDLPPVELDYLQIDQVLTNLLENAMRYTPPGSPIDISVQLCDDSVMVSVADRGPGVPPSDFERVFDKFYRVLNTEKTTRTIGSGLGLAVCRGLIEAHGGRIWVENRPEGGAIFRFTLPLRKAEGMQHE